MPARVLLVGPHDPDCGEYTFVAPPLGVWRLAGVLRKAGHRVDVFDPNCCGSDGDDSDDTVRALDAVLSRDTWDLIGFSTTGMTLRFDLALAHRARKTVPGALLVAGGMEATFDPAGMFRAGCFDLVVLGEGERPLLELADRLSRGAEATGVPGTALPGEEGRIVRIPQAALTHDELREAIFATPYEEMPYPRYWKKLEQAYRVGRLPVKADREARLAEIRSVRVMTLNYCPMGCTFCSSTNFLDAAQGSTARIARLSEEDCVAMLRRIVAAHPDVRTIIFQDDIFVFPADRRILPLCDAIVAAKEKGELPKALQFISTNRIDAMTPERLTAMRRAGFRVLGFGVESFSRNVLREFNKERIHPLIDGVLETALSLGMTPFLDIILTSPRECRLGDLAETIRRAHRFTVAGCEVGMYPYVIPFSGAVMAGDRSLAPHTDWTTWPVQGTDTSLVQATRILPVDPTVSDAILEIEQAYLARLALLSQVSPHLPSRVRSLLWILAAIPTLAAAGEEVPRPEQVFADLLMRLPWDARALAARWAAQIRDGARAEEPAA